MGLHLLWFLVIRLMFSCHCSLHHYSPCFPERETVTECGWQGKRKTILDRLKHIDSMRYGVAGRCYVREYRRYLILVLVHTLSGQVWMGMVVHRETKDLG